MNFEEFNHFQSQIDELRNKLLRTEQSVDDISHQGKTCPCELAETGNCKGCRSAVHKEEKELLRK